MDGQERDWLLGGADAALPADEAGLLRALHAFTAQRLAAARACRLRLVERPEAATLHAFLRECWEALDGLAREVNLVMHALFPAAGLYAPFEMTRQCTFYVVRKLLHDCPRTAAHPVSDLLWSETREDASAAYRRLSYLYNVSLFLPLAPADGRLPGAEDLPPAARALVRPQQVGTCPLGEGSEEMLAWEEGLVAECYRRLTDTAFDHEGHEEHEGRHSSE